MPTQSAYNFVSGSPLDSSPLIKLVPIQNANTLGYSPDGLKFNRISPEAKSYPSTPALSFKSVNLSQDDWAKILTPSLINCVTLDRLLNLSVI